MPPLARVPRKSMHIQPFCLASAAKPAADVWYHEVAVPSAASVQNAFAHAEELETRSGHVDFTAFVDFALRFTCAHRSRDGFNTRLSPFVPLA